MPDLPGIWKFTSDTRSARFCLAISWVLLSNFYLGAIWGTFEFFGNKIADFSSDSKIDGTLLGGTQYLHLRIKTIIFP